jgi:predicted nucleic-acid-binding Zn-ribbon protein
MRTTHCCTKCGFNELFHLPETGHYGLFEVYVCAECGFSETYVRADARGKLAKAPGVRRVKGVPAPGPYR